MNAEPVLWRTEFVATRTLAAANSVCFREGQG
jgi:hypothetical protein